MRTFPTIKETKIASVKLPNFLKGLNKLVSNTQIQSNELSEAVDVQLIEDGKVQCPRTGQAYYGSTSGSRVQGISGFYLSNGTTKLVRSSGTHLQVYNTGTGNFDNISGATYTTSLNTEMITAYDKLYVCNGTDALTYYDGSTITTFTAVSTPGAPTATRTAGSAGSFTFSYKITAVTAAGETAPSSAGTNTLTQGTLDSTHYFTVTWSAVTNATGYNVYGRKDGLWHFIASVEGNASNTYVDQGSVSDATVLASSLPPEGDTTGGPKGKYISLYKDTLFISGDPNNPSRLYYSGGGDKINDFNISNGGGFIDIAKNDGTVITGTKVFKNTLLVFKQDSIYQFSFDTSGLPNVVQVNPAIGCIAPRSIIQVENDIYFASRRGIFTVGNEIGYAFDVLRTNELSAKVRSLYQGVDTNYRSNIAAVYATVNSVNIVVFSYTPTGSTTNSRALVFDRDRMAWYEWRNISANCWVQFIDTDKSTKVLYGDDASGYVKRILSGSDDFGSAIHGYFKTGAQSFGGLNFYKTLRDWDIILRTPTGTPTVSIIVDGVTTALTIPISTISPSVSWKHYMPTRFLLGKSVGSGASSQDDNVLRTKKNANILGRSFLWGFDNNSTASFILLEIDGTARPRSPRFRQSSDIITS